MEPATLDRFLRARRVAVLAIARSARAPLATPIEITPDRILTHDFRPEAGWFGRLYFGIYRWLRPVPA
jgi:hypothetical protein